MNATRKTGKQHFIIIVAEGVGRAHDFAEIIEKRTGIESRATVLGHVQRGGSPTLRDRVAASQMGYRAVQLLLEGKFNRVVGEHGNDIVDFDITEALNMHKSVDTSLVDMAKIISI
jgi:6-phosphofructokinase 1